MATTFEVLFLGNLPVIDTGEGDQFVSQAAVAAWLGTYGSVSDPLSNTAQAEFAPGSTGFSGGLGTAYDLNNAASNDTFTIDGDEKTHDATMLFDATLTYKDGSTTNITAVVTQDTNGDAYLMPEVSNNADAAALSAGPVAALTLNAPLYANGNPGQGFNLSADRFASNFVPCFTPGTLIATKSGEVRVEDLRVGDRVITRDNGLQDIVWTGRKALSKQQLAGAPDLQPVLIRAGALAEGSPESDTLVSPNHRMLMISHEAEMIFGAREVLVPAKHLTRMDGVERARLDAVTYIHIMFRHHQVILADGAWSESFQPGEMALRAVERASRDEILRLFPELAECRGDAAYPAARPVLKEHETRLLTPRRAPAAA